MNAIAAGFYSNSERSPLSLSGEQGTEEQKGKARMAVFLHLAFRTSSVN